MKFFLVMFVGMLGLAFGAEVSGVDMIQSY